MEACRLGRLPSFDKAMTFIIRVQKPLSDSVITQASLPHQISEGPSPERGVGRLRALEGSLVSFVQSSRAFHGVQSVFVCFEFLIWLVSQQTGHHATCTTSDLGTNAELLATDEISAWSYRDMGEGAERDKVYPRRPRGSDTVWENQSQSVHLNGRTNP